jgi:hypothetical protein
MPTQLSVKCREGQDHDRVGCAPRQAAASVLTVKLKSLQVGVPGMVPFVALSASPSGACRPPRKVYGAVPPLAEIAWL